MTVFYWLAFPAHLMLIVTALARLADLGRRDWAFRHHLRRVGLILVGTIAVTYLGTPFTDDAKQYVNPSWRLTAFVWGWVCVWLTTEFQPPWYDYILGVHRRTEQWKTMGWRGRLQGEWLALKASFRPRRRRRPIVVEVPQS